MPSPTQSYFNHYDERGRAVQVPRLRVASRIDRLPTQMERDEAKELTLARVWRGVKFAAAAIIVGGLIGLIYVHVGPWGFVAISASYLVGHFFGKAEGEKKQ